jgi:hypothetical protein
MVDEPIVIVTLMDRKWLIDPTVPWQRLGRAAAMFSNSFKIGGQY